MRDYGKIYTQIWNSRKFKSLTSDDSKLLYFYLHTCPTVNSVGCFILRPGYAAADLGWEIYRFHRAIEDLSKALLIGFDEGEELVRITDFLKHDPFTNRNHAAGAIKLARSLPDCAQKIVLFQDIARQKFTENLDTSPPEFDSPSIALSHGYRTPEPEPEPKKKEEEDAQARDLQFAKMEESPSNPAEMADPVPAGLVDDLIQALGVDPVNRPVFWREPAASAHIAAWLTKLDLTPDQILAAARDSRTKNPEAPDGPKALDRWMAQVATGLKNAAGVKGRASGRAEARPPPSPEERMDTYAKAIKDGTALGRPQFVSVQMAQALLNSGRVTIEDLRMRGIAA